MPLTGISSMATRALLADAVAAWKAQRGEDVAIESVGGVDAAKRVQAGEAFDVVVLAADAIDALVAAGRATGPRVDLVRSPVAVAVRRGAPRPDLSSEDSLKAAVQSARSVGYSTGPSGVALLKLFDRWGIAGAIRERLVQAPPGVPVAALVARGEVELGFQQRSELIHVDGIDVAGEMPAAVGIVTTFSGAVCAMSARAGDARAFLDFLASPRTAAIKRRQGMEPA